RKIQPLCYHLRAEEDVCLAIRKCTEDAVMRSPLRRRVQVHAKETRLRIQPSELAFNPLRAEPFISNLDALALRARFGRSLDRAAIMATEMMLREVVRHRD